jgi:hypothetical protein
VENRHGRQDLYGRSGGTFCLVERLLFALIGLRDKIDRLSNEAFLLDSIQDFFGSFFIKFVLLFLYFMLDCSKSFRIFYMNLNYLHFRFNKPTAFPDSG